MTMRIAFGVEYDGRAYVGWQKQKSGTGVQTVVEKALSQVANESVTTTCAGRTDTGVHAAAQVVHIDTDASRAAHNWVLGANSNLPADVSISWAKEVDKEFHARFSATSRSYRYLILNRPIRSGLWHQSAWWVHESLDTDRMHAAAERLVGRHDFSAFRASGCQARSPVREINAIVVERSGALVSISVTANAFLQHMVRNIAGVLAAIGTGQREPSWIQDVLESKNREAGGIAAPPHGLTLVGVEYPDRYGIPTNTAYPEFRL